jgi:hypothetical protein
MRRLVWVNDGSGRADGQNIYRAWSARWRRFPGDILAAAAQSAFLHTFYLLALLLPLAHAVTFSAAMTFFMAALLTFLYIWEIGCGEPAALFCAAGWTFRVSWGLGTVRQA